eukprot:scaffold53098_cov24-Tisochrysis_lutea.AAC.3
MPERPVRIAGQARVQGAHEQSSVILDAQRASGMLAVVACPYSVAPWHAQRGFRHWLQDLPPRAERAWMLKRGSRCADCTAVEVTSFSCKKRKQRVLVNGKAA